MGRSWLSKLNWLDRPRMRRTMLPMRLVNAEVLGGAELLGDDTEGGFVEAGGAPAEGRIDGAIDAAVEQGEEHAEDARVGVAAADEDAIQAGFAETADGEAVEPVAEFFQHEIAGAGRNNKVQLAGAWGAGLTSEFAAEERVGRVDETGEDAAWKRGGAIADAGEDIGGWIEGALKIDDDDSVHGRRLACCHLAGYPAHSPRGGKVNEGQERRGGMLSASPHRDGNAEAAENELPAGAYPNQLFPEQGMTAHLQNIYRDTFPRPQEIHFFPATQR
jgi:hypothetical protein